VKLRIGLFALAVSCGLRGVALGACSRPDTISSDQWNRMTAEAQEGACRAQSAASASVAQAGERPRDVRSHLGVPLEIRSIGNTTTWRYGASNASDVRFVDGIVEGTAASAAAAPGLDSNRLAEVQGLAQYNVARRQPELALRYAQRCLVLDPRNKACAGVLSEIRPQLKMSFDAQLNAVPTNDLYGQLRILKHATTVFGPEDTTYPARLKDVTDQIETVRHETSSFVESVRRREATVLPPNVAAVVDTVPEAMLAVSSLELQAIASKASTALARNDLQDAYRTLVPRYSTRPEVKELLEQIHEKAAAELTDSLGRVKESGSIDGVARFLGALEGNRGLVTEEAIKQAQRDAETLAIDLLKSRVPNSQFGNPASARVFAAALQHSAPVLVSALGNRLTAVVGAVPAVAARVRLDRVAFNCPDVAPVVAESIALKATTLRPFVNSASADINIETSSVRCAVKDTQDVPEPISATYVASYQQEVNPLYVQLQSQLQQAQIEYANLKADHAANPPNNGWTGAAYGLAEGLSQGRVTRLQQQVAQTPPFLSRPVELAYTFQRVQTRRTATVVVSMTVNDTQTGFGDSIELVGTSESSATGQQGVNGRDSQHTNYAPSLTTPSQLEIAALEKIDFPSAVRTLGQRLFLARAVAAFNANAKAPQVLGNLLFARDLDSNSINLQPFNRAFGDLDAISLDGLGSLKVDPALFPRASRPLPATRPAASRATVTTTSPRNREQVLKDVMSAVVLIKAGDSTGSGFFVGSDGFLLTNAHVIEGASRVSVHTADDESFLATTVMLSSAHDLALLRVSARPKASLRLGDSSSVSVGADVIAIGSPLGLQGTVTKGIISAIRKLDGDTFLQIDAAINPGNSGGPLLTENGDVIGINSWKVRPSLAQSLGFAISIDDAKRIFKDYLAR
jgi:S1-C subfamily serine protease